MTGPGQKKGGAEPFAGGGANCAQLPKVASSGRERLAGDPTLFRMEG